MESVAPPPSSPSGASADPLDVPIGGITDEERDALGQIGVQTVADLLWHLPRDWRDGQQAMALRDVPAGGTATLIVEVASPRAVPLRRGKRKMVEATISDHTGRAKALWFNQPWMASKLKDVRRIVITGTLSGRSRITVKEWRPARPDETLTDLQGATLYGTYPGTQGCTPTRVREIIAHHRRYASQVSDPLPARIRRQENLLGLADAIRMMHWPESRPEVDAARKRLAFDELLALQVALLLRRGARETTPATARLDGPRKDTARWLEEQLPFELTAAQRRAIDMIDEDLAAEHPMQRLLMGDVGSGKTAVALYAMLRAVEHDCQACLLAPTETLARQHHQTIQKLLPGSFMHISLLTGSTPAADRRRLLYSLRHGYGHLVVGTHALLEPDVRFASLAVAVIDEQHRFGVDQRAALDAKAPEGRAPHILHMTATPIPRTLALAIHGDLDVTTLDELPAGRLPVETHIVETDRLRKRAYERIREEVDQGRQAFVVCPLVEESQEIDAAAATAEYERLAKGPLAGLRVQLMHGRMRPVEKQRAMADFAGGSANVLVATTVIEVGIDVPNATVMLVENAERMGISQLHQLRGRVGRGGHPSLCLLCGSSSSRRLQALRENNDGFKLAEVDLELRGEGELVGRRQHGEIGVSVASLPQDAPLLDRARTHARDLLAADPGLRASEHQGLREQLLPRHGHSPDELLTG